MVETKGQDGIPHGCTNDELLIIYHETGRLDIKKELALRYLYIVKSIAIQMRDVYVSFTQMEDMVNEGVLILMNAIDKYQPDRNAKFETYVSKRIRGMIIDIARKQDWVPRTVRKGLRQINEASAQFYVVHGRSPTSGELSKAVGMDVKKMNSLMGKASLSAVLSLDMILEETQEKYRNVQIPSDNKGEQPEESFFNLEFKNMLMNGIRELKKNEQTVISLYYVEELSMKQIASVMDVSEPRISQIHSSAIKKLREYIEEQNVKKEELYVSRVL